MLIHVGDTLPALTGQIKVNGEPFDLTPGTTTVTLKLFGPGDAVIEELATKSVSHAGRVTYSWQTGDTDTVGVYSGSWIVETASGTFTQPGVDVTVYDPEELWASTAAVEAIAGHQADIEPVVVALVQTQQAILSWVTREIPTNPVPDRVRRAHAIMAARVITAPSFGPGSSSGVIQESIGDHSVRYARPQETAAVLDPSMHPEVVKLLKPWAPTNYTSATSTEGGGSIATRSTDGTLSATNIDYTSTATVADALNTLFQTAGTPGPAGPAGPTGPAGTTNASEITTGTLAAAQLPNLQPLYGAGGDGNATITGTTTLTKDGYYDNLTVNGTLNTANFRLFVSGTLAGTGTIACNGVNGTNSATGAAAVAAQVFAASGAGGSGQTGSSGSSGSAVTNRLGGTGGAGGDGVMEFGGAAQTGTALVANQGGLDLLQDPLSLRSGTAIGSSTVRVAGGAGGSAGGADSDNLAGGGGGSGGGIVYLCARNVTFTGSIEAKGGNGGARTVAGNATGGGGGGGGGVVCVVTGSGTQTFTTSVAGGAGGAAGPVAGGNAGSSGGAGRSQVFLGVK
jgi:hypothetical protein